MIRKIWAYYMKRRKPIDYARKIGVRLGDNCRLIGLTDWDSEPWLIDIGNHVEISSEVRFVTHDGSTWCFRERDAYKNVLRYGYIKIKDNCFIGTRSTIMPGVTIGPNSIVGACSLVTKDIPEGEVWGGVPAKFITTVDKFAEKCLAETPNYDKKMMQCNRKKTIEKVAKNGKT